MIGVQKSVLLSVLLATLSAQSLFGGRGLASDSSANVSSVVTTTATPANPLLYGASTAATSDDDNLLVGGIVGYIPGGFITQALGTCFQPMVKVYSKDLIYFLGFRLTKCETQVVAGINYRLTIERPGNRIPKCQLQIFQSLDNYYYVTGTGNASTDCLVLLSNLKGNSTATS